jgi:hypothetical protein
MKNCSNTCESKHDFHGGRIIRVDLKAVPKAKIVSHWAKIVRKKSAAQSTSQANREKPQKPRAKSPDSATESGNLPRNKSS